MAFLSAPQIAPHYHAPHLWQLESPLTYRDDSAGTFTVRPGAITDGASIPRLFWTLIGPPMRDSRVLRAAVVHDQLYKSLGILGTFTRAQCDAIFYRALRAAGVPAYKAWLYWSGVRSGGWVGWRRYARHPDQFIRRDAGLIDWQPLSDQPPD